RTGDHAHQILHISHFLDLLDLGFEVVKVKFILAYLFLKFGSFLFVKLLLRTFYKGNHVTHPQYSGRHTIGMEYIKGIHLLACTDKFDRLVDHRFDGEGSTTAGVTIQLSQYNSRKVESVIESLSGIHSVLTGHRIYDE